MIRPSRNITWTYMPAAAKPPHSTRMIQRPDASSISTAIQETQTKATELQWKLQAVSRELVESIAATNLETIVGKVDWSSGPVKNVSKTPLVGGQWQKEGDHFDLKIVANAAAPNIPLTGELKLLVVPI